MLTKKVRKSRSVQEIIDDALALHKEAKRLPSKGKKINKQPPNSFSIFCKAKRPSLVEKHPELKFGEIHKKLCEKWKGLPDEKREKYVTKAEKAKLEYYAEIKKIYDQQISEIKKPLSAYDLWKSERIQDEELDGDETENDFLVEWEKLPKSTKKGWLQAAASEKEKYDLEVINVTGSSSKEMRKIAKDKKSNAETTGQKKSESDSQWQSMSSPENSGLKRKANSSEQISKSPVKKIVKKEASSHSENSESDSSDED